MFMATSFVFLSVIAAFQRPGTTEIKPRQGPGEQTGPGPGPGVMKWKMFTPQAALECTCTNRMRPAHPLPPGGPTAWRTSLYGLAFSLAWSMLRPTVKIRNKGIQSSVIRGRKWKKRHPLPKWFIKVLVSSLKAWLPKIGEICTLMSDRIWADTFIYLCISPIQYGSATFHRKGNWSLRKQS